MSLRWWSLSENEVSEVCMNMHIYSYIYIYMIYLLQIIIIVVDLYK